MAAGASKPCNLQNLPREIGCRAVTRTHPGEAGLTVFHLECGHVVAFHTDRIHLHVMCRECWKVRPRWYIYRPAANRPKAYLRTYQRAKTSWGMAAYARAFNTLEDVHTAYGDLRRRGWDVRIEGPLTSQPEEPK